MMKIQNGFLTVILALFSILPSTVIGQEKEDSSEMDALIQRSIGQLIAAQEEDGAWPYQGVYRVAGKIPVGYRVGGSGIVSTALLYGSESAESDKAIEKAVTVMCKDLSDPLMEPSDANRYDVRVWGHIYALDFFCRLKMSNRLEAARTQSKSWIPKLVEALKHEQIADGGWNYASQRRHACFVTAPAAQALLLAKQTGSDVPDEMLLNARKVLVASRSEEGAFVYGGTGDRALLPGSIARSAMCESTLWLLGANEESQVDHLRDSIEAFHKYWDELEKRRKKSGTHMPPYGVAPYYFYYGHRYLAEAIQFLPEDEQGEQRKRFNATLMRTKDENDTWNDRVFDRSKAYGTAMALLGLLEIPAPDAMAAR